MIDWLAQGRAMPMGLTLGADGNPIWADYARGDIRSLDDQDREFPLALRAGGRPVAVGSTGQGALVWTTDGEFPRRVRMADPDSGLPRDLIAGEDVNRPSAVAIDARSHVLYWAEHTNGRILRAKLDGADPEEIVNERQLVSFGLGLDLEDRRLLWSDYLGGRILAVSVDGADPEVLWDRGDGLVAPAGLVVEAESRRLYVADPGAGAIFRLPLDGGAPAVVDFVTPDGTPLLAPWGIARSESTGRLYWTDRARGELWVTEQPKGRGVALAAGSSPLPAVEASSGCFASILWGVREYWYRMEASLGGCLDLVRLAKGMKWRSDDTRIAGPGCRSMLSRAPDVGAGAEEFQRELETRLLASCRGSEREPGLDRLGPTWDGFGRCVTDSGGATRCIVRRARSVYLRYLAETTPRVNEWLEEIRPYLGEGAPEAVSGDPVEVVRFVDSVHAAIAGVDVVADAAAAVVGGVGTGQRTSYRALRAGGGGDWSNVPDDGSLRRAMPLRYRDNGDGTITDLAAGLMWEKKCDGCATLHEVSYGYAWSGDGVQTTIWDWLEAVNRENGTGFAGYSDWRIPNAKELFTILNFERFNPSVSPAFDGQDCGSGCSDTRSTHCSCTGMSYHWTSTTFADFPAHAVVVGFHLPLVGDRHKAMPLYVRAVRDAGAAEVPKQNER